MQLSSFQIPYQNTIQQHYKTADKVTRFVLEKCKIKMDWLCDWLNRLKINFKLRDLIKIKNLY
jgi:hypothetical protein